MTVPYLDALKLREALKGFKPKESIHILDYPDEGLFRQGRREAYSPAHFEMAMTMFDLHYKTNGCAALAATQLSLRDPFYITVIDFSEHKNEPLCLINATIVDEQGSRTEPEGCMSVYPGQLQAPVTRADEIDVEALDLYGNKIAFHATDFLAKCIQHELDHLEGKVYLSRLSGMRRQRMSKKIQKILKQKPDSPSA